MTYAHYAYLLYMSGSACFFFGTLVLWLGGEG
jgi:hypothetical protein